MLNWNTKSRTQRPGSVYIAVLGVSIIVAVIGISSLHVARLEVRESTAIDEMTRARIAARSGTECAVYKIKSNPTWRTTYENGTVNSLGSLSYYLPGDDTFTFTLTDVDGDLDDDADDAVTIRCVGIAGDARHVIETMLQPTGAGLTCLSASLHAGGNISVSAALTTTQTISANGNIMGAELIQGNAQAAGTIGGSPSGTRQQGMSPALEMPDPASVFEYYIANGTHLSYSQLPAAKIERVVLSATNNPYGSQVPNPQGIYVIDCQGNKISILESRIQGTLVFLNATGTIELEKSILCEPAIVNFPAIMVQGSLHMKWEQQTNLSESLTGVNFNPGHTPFEGASDSDTGDTYPSKIVGLVYATGALTVTNQANVNGVVVAGGSADVANAMGLTYKSLYFSSAPPGFTSGTDMDLVPGTWKQVAY